MNSRHAPASPRRRTRLGAAALAVAAACAGDTPQPQPGDAPAVPAAAPNDAGTATGPPTDVDIFFTRNEQPAPVTRRVAATPIMLDAALAALLEGPTEAERARGISSWFSSETAGMLLDVAIDGQGHATVDFADFSTVIPNASTSTGSTLLLAELNQTVFQFHHVRSVEYRFEGDCARFFEWLQRSCERIERQL